MVIEPFSYEAAGLNMAGRIVRPDSVADDALGILLFPDAFGLGEHALTQAERFAALGHVVLACDLHGDGRRLEALPDVLEFVGQVQADPSDIRKRASGAMAALEKASQLPPSRLVSVGYCLGGTMGLELARSGAPIAATVGLHCGLGTRQPEDASNIKGLVLMCIGADDPIVSPEERAASEKEMRAGGVDWQLDVYGGVVHSFTDPSVDRLNQPHVTRYDAKADRRSWAAIVELLDEVSRPR